MAETSMLKAEAAVALADPLSILDRLAEHLAEHAEVTVEGPLTILCNRFGRAELQAEGNLLRMKAQGPDATSLSVIKAALAEQLAECVGRELKAFTWTGDDAARRDLPYFRTMEVLGSHDLTPRMRRVVLGGDTKGLDQGGLHVRVVIPPAGRTPCWPHAAADGRVVWPRGEDALAARVYTIRSIDHERSQIAIDVVLHPDCSGPGSVWACTAAAGDIVGIMGPGGGKLETADFYLLAGDETALPAIARIMEAMPCSARAVVRIEIEDPAEEQPLCTNASVDLRWLHRNGRPAGTTTLLEEAIATVQWPAERNRIHAFAGCEQAQARSLRTVLASYGIDKTDCSIAAYWRRGSAVDAE